MQFQQAAISYAESQHYPAYQNNHLAQTLPFPVQRRTAGSTDFGPAPFAFAPPAQTRSEWPSPNQGYHRNGWN
jgi:hypothetical protein